MTLTMVVGGQTRILVQEKLRRSKGNISSLELVKDIIKYSISKRKE